MTGTRPPPPVSAPVLNALVAVEQGGKPCWRVRKYLGSMLTLEFGSKLRGSDGAGAFEMGSSGMGVRDCEWRFVIDDTTTGSESADDATGALMTRLLAGASLAGCERRNRRMLFHFSNAAVLSVDLTNAYGAEEDEAIASLQLEGGAFFELFLDGRFALIPSASARPRTELAA